MYLPFFFHTAARPYAEGAGHGAWSRRAGPRKVSCKGATQVSISALFTKEFYGLPAAHHSPEDWNEAVV